MVGLMLLEPPGLQTRAVAVAAEDSQILFIFPAALAALASSYYKFPTTTQPHSLPALHPLSAHLLLALTLIP
jgi:hypothetical protein